MLLFLYCLPLRACWLWYSLPSLSFSVCLSVCPSQWNCSKGNEGETFERSYGAHMGISKRIGIISVLSVCLSVFLCLSLYLSLELFQRQQSGNLWDVGWCTGMGIYEGKCIISLPLSVFISLPLSPASLPHQNPNILQPWLTRQTWRWGYTGGFLGDWAGNSVKWKTGTFAKQMCAECWV